MTGRVPIGSSHDAVAPLQPGSGIVRFATILTATILASSAFACATPFAALATWAALSLPRREGVALIALAWLVNQAVGFGLHAYPHDLATAAWGLAIGLGAFAAWPAAIGMAQRVRGGAVPSALVALMAAFAAYEAVLYAATFVLPGGAGAYAPAVLLRLFLINAGALAGLALLQTATARLVARGRAQVA